MKISMGDWPSSRPLNGFLRGIGFSWDTTHAIQDKLQAWGLIERPRKVMVKIDRYDMWCADQTLAMVILPVLTEYRKNIEGIPGSIIQEVCIREGVSPAVFHCPVTPENEKERERIEALCADLWKERIDSMISYFSKVASGIDDDYNMPDDGIQAFAKHFRDLWT